MGETKEILEDMKKNLAYEPETGRLIYKNDRYGTKTPGEEAGTVDNQGYKRFTYKERLYMVHRVCYALYHGHWPRFNIDHINRDSTDNRICNLRDVPQSLNNHNRGKYKNTTYYRGVTKKDKLYQARITYMKKVKSLGYYETPEEAAMAYDKAAIDIYGEFATLNFPEKFR